MKMHSSIYSSATMTFHGKGHAPVIWLKVHWCNPTWRANLCYKVVILYQSSPSSQTVYQPRCFFRRSW